MWHSHYLRNWEVFCLQWLCWMRSSLSTTTARESQWGWPGSNSNIANQGPLCGPEQNPLVEPQGRQRNHFNTAVMCWPMMTPEAWRTHEKVPPYIFPWLYFSLWRPALPSRWQPHHHLLLLTVRFPFQRVSHLGSPGLHLLSSHWGWAISTVNPY